MLNVGTDCSGIEAPICALNNLGVKYNHIFSCEIDKYARQSIRANYSPNKIYKDIKEEKEKCELDIYVCGFPCQPFSLSGNRKGSSDPRGTIFDFCVKSINLTNTKVFILENVRGLISVEDGEYWKYILSELKKLDKYNIYYKVLNTKDYGIPQNRERVYIVGIHKKIQHKEFNFPKCIKMKSIKDYVDKRKLPTEKPPIRKQEVINILSNSKATFLNLGWQNFKEHSYEHFSPTILAQATMWCVPKNRRATIKELLSLQGFPTNFKQVVSDTQMKKQIGNSMSVNVLEHLFVEIIKSVLGHDLFVIKNSK